LVRAKRASKNERTGEAGSAIFWDMPLTNGDTVSTAFLGERRFHPYPMMPNGSEAEIASHPQPDKSDWPIGAGHKFASLASRAFCSWVCGRRGSSVRRCGWWIDDERGDFGLARFGCDALAEEAAQLIHEQGILTGFSQHSSAHSGELPLFCICDRLAGDGDVSFETFQSLGWGLAFTSRFLPFLGRLFSHNKRLPPVATLDYVPR
jgi:hypothetical protein